jgi:hypothetical protein
MAYYIYNTGNKADWFCLVDDHPEEIPFEESDFVLTEEEVILGWSTAKTSQRKSYEKPLPHESGIQTGTASTSITSAAR